MARFENVRVTMFDEFTGETVVRTIDKSNVYIASGEYQVLAKPETQRKLLETWITERANDQHQTLLTLVSWELV